MSSGDGRTVRRRWPDRTRGQVLRLVASGKTNRAIAGNSAFLRRLSPATSPSLTKIGVPSRAAATAYAYENGLI